MTVPVEMIATNCDICGGAITVPKRPYRAGRLCAGCAAFDRLRGIELAAHRLWHLHDNFLGLPPHERRRVDGAWLDLRDALNVPEPKGDR